MLRALLALAWPVVLARSSQAVIGFCDAFMTAPLGEHALAATTTGAFNMFFFVLFFMGTAFIVQSFAAQLHGKNDIAGARRYAWYGLLLAVVVAVLGVAMVPATDGLLGLFPYEPELHRLMGQYLDLRLLAAGPMVGIEVLGNWYGGLGNTRLHMIAGMVAMVLNVALNWILIQGHLGAPALGVPGAALASVIATWVAFFLLLAVFLTARPPRPAAGARGLSWAELGRMLRFGMPNGVTWFLEFGAFALFINIIVAKLGTTVQAAMMVVFSINAVSFMPAFGLASSGAILSGQAIGRGQHDEVRTVVRLTVAAAAAWQCGVGIWYLVLPDQLMTWFAPPGQEHTAGELVGIGSTMLAISAAWQLFDAVAMCISETLRAAGDTAWCMWARLLLSWLVFAPGGILTVWVLRGGAVAAILCVVVYIAILAAVFAWRFYVSGAWRHIELTESDGELLPD